MVLQKSARFPSVSLDYAVESAAQAHKFGAVLSDAHFTLTGSTKSGAFTRKKASLKYYGLIEAKGSEIRLTPLAIATLSTNNQEKESALKEAFLKPELFNTLYISTQKGAVLPVDMLGSIAVKEYGIQPKAKEEFVNTFIKSGIYAGLVRYTEGSREEVVFLENDKVLQPTLDEDTIQKDMHKNHNRNEKEGEQTVEITVDGGWARLVVPSQLGEKDAKRLKALIDILVG